MENKKKAKVDYAAVLLAQIIRRTSHIRLLLSIICFMSILPFLKEDTL